MARPRINRNQRTIDDVVIEDAALADALDHLARFVDSAKEERGARQAVKTIVQTEYSELINAVDERGHPVWIICGNHRINYRTTDRPAGKKPAPAGVTTLLEIHRLAD